MRPSPRSAIALLVAAAWGAPAAAQDVAWQVTPRVERSDVSVRGNDGRWDAWSVVAARVAGPGQQVGASLARQDRNGRVDDELQLFASGRRGGWGASASIQASTDPVFLPRWGYQLQVDRSVGRNRSAGLGYRTLRFNGSRVHLGSAHMVFYRGDDELGVEYRFGRNAALDHDIRVVQARAVMFRGRNRLGLYLARGDYLFDALGIPGGDGAGWAAHAAFARSITPTTTLQWEVGAGGEADVFRQRSIAVSVRYSP